MEGRESCFSFVLTLSLSRCRGRKRRVCTRAARRVKASLSLRRVPRFEIKHLASRPSAPLSLPSPPRPPACTRARTYIHGCTRLISFSNTQRRQRHYMVARSDKENTFSLYREISVTKYNKKYKEMGRKRAQIF